MPTVSELARSLNTVWVLTAAALVFFMEGGFALLEAGLVRSKNTINIIMKVLMDISVGALVYWAVGFGLMFGHSGTGLLGLSNFFLQGHMSGLTVPKDVFWLFEAAFAVAMISIVSGAVAERMRFRSYVLYVALAAAVVYPIAGGWVWNPNGFLNRLGMLDFAGSGVVHAVGGFAALAAAILLGPRLGKYRRDGSASALPGNNLPLAMAGTFILWFGWFGFNAGSTLSALDHRLSLIALNTELAGMAGAVAATWVTMRRYRQADPTMTINGLLIGLVAITAGCAYVAPYAAVLIGLGAGLLVAKAVPFIDRLHVDDPVGAIAVHGLGGSLGVLAVGFFATRGGLFYGGGLRLLGVQALGLVILVAWAFLSTYGIFKLLAATVGIRVPATDEETGLDLGEHGMPAYFHGDFEPVGEDEVLLAARELPTA